jgi:hypothetical protein
VALEGGALEGGALEGGALEMAASPDLVAAAPCGGGRREPGWR